MKKIDILFINPGDQKKTFQGLADKHTPLSTPSWCMLLASALRKYSEVAIYDANIQGWDAKKLIEKYSPKLIVIMVHGHNPTGSTENMPAAIKIVNDLKKHNKDIQIAIGGGHVSALPKRTLEECEADYSIQGEGLYTIKGLHDYLNGKLSIKKIPGLWYRSNDDIVKTFPAENVRNLDEDMGNYAFDLLPGLENYRTSEVHCLQKFEESKDENNGFNDVRSPYVAIYTTLGCPYQCHFCMTNGIFGGQGSRGWSADSVLGWIDELYNTYKVKNIRLDDELFVLDNSRVNKICDGLIERNYDLNIYGYTALNSTRVKLLEKMYKGGFRWLSVGVEAGNEAVRKSQKGKFPIKSDIHKTIKAIQDTGINVHANYMFGFQDDTIETMQQTLDLALDLNTEFVQMRYVNAFPGAPLFDDFSEDQLPKDWNAYSQYSYEATPLDTKYISGKEVLRFRDYAFQTYFSSEKYLRLVRNKFGEKCYNHMLTQPKVPLRRKILEEDKVA